MPAIRTASPPGIPKSPNRIRMNGKFGGGETEALGPDGAEEGDRVLERELPKLELLERELPKLDPRER